MRVLVTGNAGAGKSTTAKVMSRKLDIPYYSLDGIVWQEGWKKTPRDVRKKEVSALICRESWVIDGVDLEVMKAADTIIFLDYPRRVCLYRALRRNIPYLFSSRPELPKNCPEILILPQLLKIIWRFPYKVRPQITAELAKKAENQIHIRSNTELESYLSSIEVSIKLAGSV